MPPPSPSPASAGGDARVKSIFCAAACPGPVAMTALSAILWRDIQLAVRVGGGAWIGVLFFLIVVTLVPLAGAR